MTDKFVMIAAGILFFAVSACGQAAIKTPTTVEEPTPADATTMVNAPALADKPVEEQAAALPQPGWWRQTLSVSVTGVSNSDQVQELCFANIPLDMPVIPPGGSGPVENYCSTHAFSASGGQIKGGYECRLNAGGPSESVVSLEQTGSYSSERVEINASWSQSTLGDGEPSKNHVLLERLRDCTDVEASGAIGN